MMKRAALVLALLLTGCGTTPGPVAAPATGALMAKADAKLTEAQRRQALGLIAEKLYGKDAFTFDFQHNDAAVAKKGKNFQGNAAWFVARDLRPLEKAGQWAFVATEFTKDDAGTYQSQYKLTGVLDLKAGAVVDLKKEVEDRDPR